MPNPTIHFRLSTYQLARGLQIVRQLEPNYQLTSISKLVKTIYLDYLAKMTYTKTDSIPQHYVNEIESLLNKPIKKVTTLQELAKNMKGQKVNNKNNIETNQYEKAIKSTVTDFSLPDELFKE